MTSRPGVLDRLARSRFRSSFHLDAADAAYAREHGRDTIARHARDLLAGRVGPAEPRNDGRQTPYHGHPVFTAQHATATCCRGCIAKWHGIPRGCALSPAELDRLAGLVMAWLDQDLARDLAVRRERVARRDARAAQDAPQGVRMDGQTARQDEQAARR